MRALMRGEPVSEPGFWIGKPHPETLAKFDRLLGTPTLEDLQQRLGDDARWITPQHDPRCYVHPDGLSMRPWKDANPHGLSGIGLLADASKVADLDRVVFPSIRWLVLDETLERLEQAGPYYRLGGFWCPFFHDLCYLFGTSELLMLTLEAPHVVRAATDRICEFYYQANELLYAKAADLIDAFFFGNDFGTQMGLLVSPETFRELFLPWIRRFADQAHRHGLDCILHCCGGIADVIPDLIEAGVDGLHPFQTTARGMDPAELAARFAGRIVFWGGVDTQRLLQSGTPEEVRETVLLLDRLFNHRIVLGPSHEALLPSVDLRNVLTIPATLGRYCPEPAMP